MTCANCSKDSSKIYELYDQMLCRDCFIKKQHSLNFLRLYNSNVSVKIAMCDIGAMKLQTMIAVEKNINSQLYDHILHIEKYTKADLHLRSLRRIVKVTQPAYENLMCLRLSGQDAINDKFIELSKVIELFHSKGYFMGVLALETIGIVNNVIKIIDCSYICDACDEFDRELTEMELIPEYKCTASIASLQLKPPTRQTDLESLIYLYLLVSNSATMNKIKKANFDEMIKLKTNLIKKFKIPTSMFHISKVFLEIIRSDNIESF